MNYSIHLRPDAETDLDEAATWYERQRKGLGDEFLDEVIDALESISENPYICAVVHRHTHCILMHRFPFGIYYLVEGETLIIIAVMHGSRHPQRWQQRT